MPSSLGTLMTSQSIQIMEIVSPWSVLCRKRFSDNKDILRKNTENETLASYLMVCDGIKNEDGPIEDTITKERLAGKLIQDTRAA